MDLGLEGRTVLVTGASGGIGRALVEAFAGEGARVVCHAFAHADALRAWLDGRPWRERTLVVRADVRRVDELEEAFAAACARFGRIDVCVANAGVRTPGAARLDEADEARLRLTLDTNLLGPLLTARAFFASLRRHPVADAALLLVGSTAATFGEAGFADYAAAKAGLVGLARSLKNEIVALARDGRVNLLEPGWTATEMIRPELDDLERLRHVVRTMPLRRIARADDIARAAVWLCSPAARHVSGQTLTVAGGMEGRLLWARDEIDAERIRREARGE